MNSSVMHALNQCSTTGLESPIRELILDDGRRIELYKDHIGRYRIVAFKTKAHKKGYSGVLLDPDGQVYYKETAPDMRRQGTTRHLQGMLTAWGVHWYKSPHLTAGGAACYK